MAHKPSNGNLSRTCSPLSISFFDVLHVFYILVSMTYMYVFGIYELADAILEQLKNGIAQFELVSSSVPSIFTSSIPQANPTALFGAYGHRFFARTPNFASSVIGGLSVQRVTCDGRCLFRALAKGMAANERRPFRSRDEREDAKELRKRVQQVICENGQESPGYKEAVAAIVDSGKSLRSYCKRITRNNFCGGESELLVLSKQLGQPIYVYEHEHTNGGIGSSIRITKYGTEFTEGSRNGKPMKAVRLLRVNYSGTNHYDLLTIGETERE